MNKEKCALSDKDLIEKSLAIIDNLCKTGGKSWALSVPVDLSKDPDILFNELCVRLQKSNDEYPIITSNAIQRALIKQNEKYKNTALKNFRQICGCFYKGTCTINSKKCTFSRCESLTDLFKE
ncbi:hypothetical protein [uncultured Bacteroides sp.]|uniref:hypothetical protein n=1 Tax=uncultured Bacteroides sp. TaxID=162156 RepID=UPI002AA66B79|nr:hypothetical protein [uncultured Bacteroides sp.]